MSLDNVKYTANLAAIVGAAVALWTAIADLRAEMRAEIGSVRAEIGSVRAEIGSVRGEMRAEIGSLRTEMQAEIGSLRAEMQTEIGSLRAEVAGLRSDMGDLSERMARLEGLFEGFVNRETAEVLD